MGILVTGGAGFIGSAVVAELIDTADRVVVLDSLRPDVHRDAGVCARDRLAALDVELVVGDVRDAAVVAGALRGIDAVVHLAAKVGLGVAIDDMDVGSGIVSTVGDLARALSISRNGPEPIVTGEFRLGDVRHITASSKRIRDELSWRPTVSATEGPNGLTLGPAVARFVS